MDEPRGDARAVGATPRHPEDLCRAVRERNFLGVRGGGLCCGCGLAHRPADPERLAAHSEATGSYAEARDPLVGRSRSQSQRAARAGARAAKALPFLGTAAAVPVSSGPG